MVNQQGFRAPRGGGIEEAGMTEKTLGQVAYEAIGPPTAVADAVIAEYEARRWRAISEYDGDD